MSGGDAPPPDLKPPAGLYQGAVAAGAAKAKADPKKIFTLGVVSGCHIAFGAYLAITVGGACPGIAAENPGLQKIILGAFGLPFGLIMTLVTGGELFTGNTALYVLCANLFVVSLVKTYLSSLTICFVVSSSDTIRVTAAYKEGEIELKDLIKSWVCSYIGNFVGSLLLAYLAFKSGTLGGAPASVAIATAKSNLPWDVAFVRGGMFVEFMALATVLQLL